MAPSDFCLFPNLYSHLHGTQYGSNEGVIEAVNEYLGALMKTFYFEGIRKPYPNTDMYNDEEVWVIIILTGRCLLMKIPLGIF